MKKRMIALVATLMIALGACAYGGGDGNTTPQPTPTSAVPKPGASPTDCAWNIYDQLCYPPNGASVVSADAAPLEPSTDAEIGDQPLPSIPFRECVLNLDPAGSGLRVQNALFVKGIFHVVCVKQPTSIIVVARLERRSGKNWLDEADILADPALPRAVTSGRYAGFFKRDYQLQALCYPGTWKLEIQWFGIKANGTDHFGSQVTPVPAQEYRTTC